MSAWYDSGCLPTGSQRLCHCDDCNVTSPILISDTWPVLCLCVCLLGTTVDVSLQAVSGCVTVTIVTLHLRYWSPTRDLFCVCVYVCVCTTVDVSLQAVSGCVTVTIVTLHLRYWSPTRDLFCVCVYVCVCTTLEVQLFVPFHRISPIWPRRRSRIRTGTLISTRPMLGSSGWSSSKSSRLPLDIRRHHGKWCWWVNDVAVLFFADCWFYWIMMMTIVMLMMTIMMLMIMNEWLLNHDDDNDNNNNNNGYF